MPSSNNNKTDLESLTKTASPTIAQTNYKYDRNHQLDDLVVATTEKEIDLESKDSDLLGTKKTSSATVDFTFNKLGKDKRSLFDIDNASSLSLAEKLRNEANKYSAESQSAESQSSSDVVAATVVSVSSGLSKLHMVQAATEAQELDQENDRKNDSTPSSPLHHAMTERRPSWRLKFDAGCKVRI